MSNPKGDINTFYSKAKCSPPRYEYYTLVNPEDQKLPYFGCSLQLPGTHDDTDGFEHRTFVGKAQNKKKAADLAAEEGLVYMKKHGIYQRIMLDESQGWWPRLEKLLTEVNGWKKNPFCRKYVIEAVKFNNGQIPLTGLICQPPLHRDLQRKFGDRGIPFLLRKLIDDLQVYRCEQSPDSKLIFDEQNLVFSLCESCVEQLKEQYSYQFQPKQNISQQQNWVDSVGIENSSENLPGNTDSKQEFQSKDQVLEQNIQNSGQQPSFSNPAAEQVQEQSQVSEQQKTEEKVRVETEQQSLENQLDQKLNINQQQQEVKQIEEFVAVYLPADVKKPPYEVKFQKQGYFMSRLGECLNCPPNNLLSWGKHSPQQVKILNPDNSPADWGYGVSQEGQQDEKKPNSEIFWEEMKDPTIYSVYFSNNDQSEQKKQFDRKLNPRAMWLQNGNCGVFGDVLLSTTRVTLNDNGYTVLFWRSFTVDQFWMTINTGFPLYSYLTGLKATTIGSFPIGYWSKVHWSGEDPQRLLNGYAERKGLKPPLFKTEDNMEDDPETPLFTCKLTAWAFMGTEDDPIRTEAKALGDLDIAIQTASLRALHQIQNLDLKTLGMEVPEFNIEDLAPDVVDIPPNLGEVSLEDDLEQLEDEGEGDQFEGGQQQETAEKNKSNELFRNIAKLNYSVSVLDSSGNTVEVESHPHFSVYMGCGSVKPEIEEKIQSIGIGGKFKLDISVPIAGPDICGKIQSVPGFLKAEIIDIKQISVLIGRKGAGSGQLFATPLSEQRYKFVADVMKENKCDSVADLGCGDARFIEFVLKKGLYPQLDYIVGMDIVSRSLDRGCKRMERFFQQEIKNLKEKLQGQDVEAKQEQQTQTQPQSQEQQGDTGNQIQTQKQEQKSPTQLGDGGKEEDVGDAVHMGDQIDEPQLPVVNICQGSLINPSLVSNEVWGSNFYGIRGVALIEVIEHIHSSKTALLGPVILGGLQPQVLVVTTPNWEYNEILRFLGGSGRGPPGRDGHPLRDQDHKFEWDRKQFQKWATQVADCFGYDVEFSMIGNCIEEDLALESPQCRANQKVGGATQAAVFTFNGNFPPSTPQIQWVYSTTAEEAETGELNEEWVEEEDDNDEAEVDAEVESETAVEKPEST